MQSPSPWWVAYCIISFVTALVMSVAGIWSLNVPLWTAGYFLMATLLLVASTFSLAKTLRDQHESRRLVQRLDEAKTEQLLRQYDVATSPTPTG
jgi:hypothetical protein